MIPFESERNQAFVISTHLDVRLIASLYRHFKEKGLIIPSLSSLIREVLELAAEELHVTPMSTQDSIDYLELFNISSVQFKERMKRTLLKDLCTERWGTADQAKQEAISKATGFLEEEEKHDLLS